MKCPKCGNEVWDIGVGHKLNKCWGCMIAFDNYEEEDFV